jgi:hypothetical protein
MQGIRRHLTYANVISTLCLFILLGGGAYAAFHLPKNSVRSKNIVNGKVKGHDVAKSAISSRTIKNKSVKDTDIQDLETSDGLVQLEPGESQTLFTRGPFTVRLSCRTQGDREVFSEVLADSSAPDSQFTYDAGHGTMPPEAFLAGANSVLGSGAPNFNESTFVLAAPGGTTVTGFAAAGTNALNSTCFGLATGLGGGADLPSG